MRKRNKPVVGYGVGTASSLAMCAEEGYGNKNVKFTKCIKILNNCENPPAFSSWTAQEHDN